MNTQFWGEYGSAGIPEFGHVRSIAKGLQQIIVTVLNKGGFNMLTAVYGSNWQSRRTDLWRELTDIHQQLGSLPWAVAGDFNIVKIFK